MSDINQKSLMSFQRKINSKGTKVYFWVRFPNVVLIVYKEIL